jgi:cytochrome c6
MNSTLIQVMRNLVLGCAFVVLASVSTRADDSGPLFKAKCAACHGPDGKGETSMGKMMKVRDMSSEDVQKQTDAALTDIITNGKGKMPAYKGKLTDDQIKQLVGFIRTFKK